MGMMNLSGVPFLFSGGWTKEEVLHSTAHWHLSLVPHYLMIAGVILTALYMTRQMIYVFFGSKHPAPDAHESPRVMTMPLLILAFCSILFVLVLTPAWPWLHAYLSGEPARVDFVSLIQPVLLLSLVLVAGGIGLGWLIYRNVRETDTLVRVHTGLFRILANKR